MGTEKARRPVPMHAPSYLLPPTNPSPPSTYHVLRATHRSKQPPSGGFAPPSGRGGRKRPVVHAGGPWKNRNATLRALPMRPIRPLHPLRRLAVAAHHTPRAVHYALRTAHHTPRPPRTSAGYPSPHPHHAPPTPHYVPCTAYYAPHLHAPSKEARGNPRLSVFARGRYGRRLHEKNVSRDCG